jgi:hypothetical protein
MDNMSMDISRIHFRGARILRVMENTDQRSLTFKVNYPLTDLDPDFKRGQLIFWCYRRYLVSERDLNGEPIIQSAEITEVDSTGATIRIKTDYGLREVSGYSVTEEGPIVDPGTAPNGGPAKPVGHSNVPGGPPLVSEWFVRHTTRYALREVPTNGS